MTNADQISKLIRYYALLASTTAKSGHATSSLSATDIMTVLYFNHFSYDFNNPKNLSNDRLILSKGHATPLLYATYKVAGLISTEELLAYRLKDSNLQGHPTPYTPYVDVATGSLGMGLSYGFGMAYALKKQLAVPPSVYVLLGDGEMAEGQNYEALQLAAHYNTQNLIGIVDVNRLAETGPTMLGHDVETYSKRISAFGWNTIVIDGHNFEHIDQALLQAKQSQKPVMIIAHTIKGKGVSFLEDQLNKHGKALSQQEFQTATAELKIQKEDLDLRFPLTKKPLENPNQSSLHPNKPHLEVALTYVEPTPTRKAYGTALSYLTQARNDVLVLDADLSDSTFSGVVEAQSPTQFINMFIAEQNMVSTAVGISKMGYKPFVSTFSAFLTRSFDQLRMASLSEANLVVCGSHGGVTVGEDGPSGMGLEDMSMFRAIYGSNIFYPADAYAMTKCVVEAYELSHITYIRSTRTATPVIYDNHEQFRIGGSKTLKSSNNDQIALVAAGVTLHEALKAYEELYNEGIFVRVIDCYSVKPIDESTLIKASQECHKGLITIEDHYPQGGLGDAVLEVFTGSNKPLPRVTKMAVTRRPHSGTPIDNLDYQGLTSKHIVLKIKSLI